MLHPWRLAQISVIVNKQDSAFCHGIPHNLLAPNFGVMTPFSINFSNVNLHMAESHVIVKQTVRL